MTHPAAGHGAATVPSGQDSEERGRDTPAELLILGYGAFGRAVHSAIARRGDLAISVYSRSPKEFEHQPVQVFDRPAAIDVARFKIVLVALPGHAVREVLEGCSNVSPGTAFLSCVKGMDPISGRFPSDVIFEATGSDYTAVMSGASFADEMLLGRPVYLTLACTNVLLGQDLIDQLANPVLQLELTDDVRGLEIAGVGKNIIALGAGMADGLALGDNFRAAFIARGVVELREAAEKLGGRADTIVTAGALADFFLSCSSPRSRNYAQGLRLASAGSASDVLSEGLHSAELFVALLRSQHASSPYFEAIVAALAEPRLIAHSLPSR
jgi:glycerol-3-phosphate dehydrogenase (NAD(P)+)